MTPTTRPNTPVTVVFAFLDLNDGGAQRLTIGACRHLDGSRYRPVLLCLRGPGSLVDAAVAAGVPTFCLGRMRRSYDLVAVVETARLLRSMKTGIVHVPLYSRASPYARLAAHVARVPLVVGHEWCRPRPPSSGRRLVDRVLRSHTRFLAASEMQRIELLMAGVPPEHTAVVYGGIDVNRFAPADRAVARKDLDLPADRPIVLVPARLHPMKGHVDLIAAVLSLRERVPDVLVLCAGDGPLRRVLPSLVSAAGLDGAVRFLGQREDMPELMAACDVVALASHIEGLPSVIMEAFAAERAVVATAVGGVAEAVMDGYTGWLVGSHRPMDLAAALGDALTDAQARRERAERARATALARFPVEMSARRLAEVYDRWLNREDASGAAFVTEPVAE